MFVTYTFKKTTKTKQKTNTNKMILLKCRNIFLNPTQGIQERAFDVNNSFNCIINLLATVKHRLINYNIHII